MDAHGILPGFTGIAVHDGWAPYRTYDQIDHGLCNAHLLRELAAMTETGTQPWAARMADLLTGAHRSVEAAKADGQPGLDPDVLAGFVHNYDSIVAAGQAANPPPPRTGKRGRPALGKAGSLLKRFQDYRQDVLRFATDFQVPFDNNIAEQSIRMVKLQQKISGTWRTTTGATDFLTIRSYLATARKHGQQAIGVLRDLFTGQTWTIPA